MEFQEAESDSLDARIEELYRALHPSDNLRTIPGVGEHTAPVFAASIGDPARFSGQSSFACWTGVVPAARQPSDTESKGLRMTKAGPGTMKWGLYQAAQIGRRWDSARQCLLPPDGPPREEPQASDGGSHEPYWSESI